MMESVSDPSLVGTVKMKLNLASDLHSHQGRVGPQVILERHWHEWEENSLQCTLMAWGWTEGSFKCYQHYADSKLYIPPLRKRKERKNKQTENRTKQQEKNRGGEKSNPGSLMFAGLSLQRHFLRMIVPAEMAMSARSEHLSSRSSIFPFVPQHRDSLLFSPAQAAVFVSCFRLLW